MKVCLLLDFLFSFVINQYKCLACLATTPTFKIKYDQKSGCYSNFISAHLIRDTYFKPSETGFSAIGPSI